MGRCFFTVGVSGVAAIATSGSNCLAALCCVGQGSRMAAKEKVSRRKPDEAGQHRSDIRDIASPANVSIATVSRTINGVPTVDKRLAARVWKAVKQLNYYPDTQARALVSGRSRLFGLMISEITNPFFPELIQGFEEIAERHGYDILISSTSRDPARQPRGSRACEVSRPPS